MANMTDAELIKWLLDKPKTILLWGDTGEGKTALLGELAEFVYLNGRNAAGKPLRTRVYTADEGGMETIQPYADLGIVEAILLYRRPNPWEWLNEIVQGKVLDAAGKWVMPDNSDIGMWGFEGATSIAEMLRAGIAGTEARSGQRPSMTADKDAHGKTYGLAQDRMSDELKRTFALPGIKFWTARARRGEDEATSAVLGPQVVGKALTSEIPSWFQYTFRVMTIPADPMLKTPEAHRLHLGSHWDKGAKGLGNARKPLQGGDIPSHIEPASIVEAFRTMAGAGTIATTSIKEKMRKAGLIK